jgi:hypothetical protein
MPSSDLHLVYFTTGAELGGVVFDIADLIDLVH